MRCLKTGCLAYLEEYGRYVYGDAFVDNGVIVIRVCQVYPRSAPAGECHLTIHEIGQWWDKDAQENGKVDNSTLVAKHGAFSSDLDRDIYGAH